MDIVAGNATSSFPPPSSVTASLVDRVLAGVNGWTLLLTALIIILVAEQVRYRNRKGSAAGPTWTIPIMGSFLDSMHPTFEGYYRYCITIACR